MAEGQSSPESSGKGGAEILSSEGLGRRQFRGILWKNLLLKRRRPVETFLELFSPLLFILVVLMFFDLAGEASLGDTVYANRTFDIVGISKVTRTLLSAEPVDDIELLTTVSGVLEYDGNRYIPSLDEFVYVQQLLVALLSGNRTEHLGKLVSYISSNKFGNLLLPGKIALSPDTAQVAAFEAFMRSSFNKWPLVYYKTFPSEEAAVRYSRTVGGERIWAVLHFNELDAQEKTVDVKIRMNHTTLPSSQLLHFEFPRFLPRAYQKYYYSGYFTLMQAVQMYIKETHYQLNSTDRYGEQLFNVVAQSMQTQTGLDQNPIELEDIPAPTVDGLDFRTALPTGSTGQMSFVEVLEFLVEMTGADAKISLPEGPRTSGAADEWISPMPVKAFKTYMFYSTFGWLTGLLMSASLIYPVSRLIKVVVEEKELRLKELLKMMGLRDWVFHLGWIVTYTMAALCHAVMATVILGVYVYTTVSITLLFLLIFLYNCCMVSLCFCVSSFFNRAQLAAIVGPILILALLMPAYVFTFYPSHLFLDIKTSLLISAPCALTFALERVNAYSEAQQPLTWSNQFDGELSFGLCMTMLLADFFIYAFLAWYFDKVVPTKYGTHLPPWFVLKPSFWKRKWIHWREVCARKYGHALKGSVKEQISRINNWASGSGSRPSVEILSLHKIYRKGRKVAVNELSLEMRHGEICCLLGTNGAGKSTTISILTGLYEPTRGDCMVYGDSITTDLDIIRRVMGVCPQFDVLYPELSVREHLVFFCTLKGVKPWLIDAQVHDMIESVGLVDKTDTPSKALSGGMRRKLSVAIALIGDSKIIFLDEPTSGMDPKARRATWELLLKSKPNRTIILTTHYLDEADVLGDRIAIMKEGHLMCADTSLNLKSKYGLGYTLTLVKAEENCNEERIKTLVLEHLPNSKVLSMSAAEMSFQLSLKDRAKFPKLFRKIETHLQPLKIGGFGVSMSTLEEVFLKIAEAAELDADGKLCFREPLKLQGSDPSSKSQWQVSLSKPSKRRQFWENLKKNFVILRRDRGAIFNEIFLPVLLVVGIIVILSSQPVVSGPSLKLDVVELWDVLPNGPAPKVIVHNTSALEAPPHVFTPMPECDTSLCSSIRLFQQMTAKEQQAPTAALSTQCAFVLSDKIYQRVNLAEIAEVDERMTKEIIQSLRTILELPAEEINNLRLDDAVGSLLAVTLKEAQWEELIQPSTSVSLGQLLSELLAKTNLPWLDSVIARVVAGAEDILLTRGSANDITVNSLIPTVDALASFLQQQLETLRSLPVDSGNLGGMSIELARSLATTLLSNPEKFLAFQELMSAPQGIAQSFGLSFAPPQFWIPFNLYISIVRLAAPSAAELTPLLHSAEDILLANVDTSEFWKSFAALANDRKDLLPALEKFLSDTPLMQNITAETVAKHLCSYNFTSPFTNETPCETIETTAIIGYTTLFNFLYAYMNERVREDGVDLIQENTETDPVASSPESPVVNPTWQTTVTMTDGLTSLWDVASTAGILPLAFSSATKSISLLRIAGGLSLGTLLGSKEMNVTIPARQTTLFSGESPHNSAVCSALMTDAYIKASRKEHSGKERFSVWTHPLPSTKEQGVWQEIWLAFLAVLFCLVPFCYNPACYGMKAVKDRLLNAKHLMFVSGMDITMYWLSTFVFDFLCYSVVAAWTMVCFALSGAIDFDREKSQIAAGTMVLFLLYGCCSIPQAYCFSFLFDSAATCQIAITVFHFITGWAFLDLVISLEIYNFAYYADKLRPFCRLFPAYNLGEGLVTATRESIMMKILQEDSQLDVLEWRILGKNLVWMCFLSLVHFTVLILCETLTGRTWAKFGQLFRPKKSKTSVIPQDLAKELQKKSSEYAPQSDSLSNESMSFQEEDEQWKLHALDALGIPSKDVQTAPEALEDSIRSSKSLGTTRPRLDPSQSVELIQLDDDNAQLSYEPEKYRVPGLFRIKERLLGRSALRFDSFVYEEDEDIKHERIRVLQHDSDDPLVLKNLRKVYYYRGRAKVAVRRLTLGIQKGECFGFLGTNGAGKTTTMKMVTGKFLPTDGEIGMYLLVQAC